MRVSQDERGVSEVIGVVILFGFLIISLSIWQAYVVPAENEEIEFKHYEQLRQDLTQLRSDYIDAAESGIIQSASVRLGTSYPTRALFVNPPPPNGRLQSVAVGPIEATGFNVSNVCGLKSPVHTRTLKAAVSYRYLSTDEAPPFLYGNTVLYQQTANKVTYLSDQGLIQGSTINLYPLVDNVSVRSTDIASLDFVGAKTGVVTVNKSLNITIPTRLSADNWSTLLDSQKLFKSAVQVGPQRVRIELAKQQWTIQCAAVGVENAPNVDNVPNEGADDGEGDKINPAAPGDIKLLNECYDDGGDDEGDDEGRIQLSFENLANSTVNVTAARFNFYNGDTGGDKKPSALRLYHGSTHTDLPLGGAFQPIDPPISFPTGGSPVVELSLRGIKGGSRKHGWFVLTFQYDSGETGTYFISVPDKKKKCNGGGDGGDDSRPP